ncbi:rho GTPase-activating protein 7 isoform X1 [Pantherophis guttatus]|uniref:Rho GTPase-activating protein 7 n=1 Tax=Pantherophis guttatus TaxID=94885 RepID=A0A6P9BH94_PANGU|nr:rho GTPase-activating protein 7 isoform X1 [Pantherophis guttatus]
MSLAIRKRSWEEHVTQWMSLHFGSLDSNILCRHGLVVDNLQAGMEKKELRCENLKEKSASLPDCCHVGELVVFPSKLFSNVSKELDENENHQEEGDFLSLEASVETLVNVSVGSDDGNGGSKNTDLPLETINCQFMPVEDKLLAEKKSLEEPSVKIISRAEAKKQCYHTAEPTEKMSTSHEGAMKNNSREEVLILGYNNSHESKDVSKEKNWEPAVEKSILEEQIVCGATALQYEKSDEKNDCTLFHDEDTLSQHRGNDAIIRDSNHSLAHLPGSHIWSEDNNVDVCNVTNAEDECILNAPLVSEVSDLKSKTVTCQPTDCQVVLRKKKEARDQDQSRLDSMILLILKLDQLDQDIENALSESSSPSGTLTQPQKPIPDSESLPGGTVDIIAVNNQQMNIPSPSPPLPPTLYGADKVFPTPMAGSGAKPKIGAVPIITEKVKAEIEAKEACDWLQAAGFPQYVQLYEDLIFPIDITAVKREHDFLDRDAIEALCRRLNTLNKCAMMKLEISPHRKRSEDSDEDEPCAISGKWMFQRESKRWSRLEEFNIFPPKFDMNSTSPEVAHLSNATSHESMLMEQSEHHEVASIHSMSSNNSQPTTSQSDAVTTRTNSVISITSSGKLVENEGSLPSTKELSSFVCNVKANEKNTKSKTRSLLKRMESLKIKGSHHGKSKAPSKLGLIISGPILQEGMGEEKLKQLNCVEISTLNGNHINFPMVRKRSVSNSTQTSSSSSQSETSSAVSTPSPITRTRSLGAYNKRVGMYLEGFDPFNQSTFNDVMEQNFKNRDSFAEDTVFFIPEDHKPGTFPKALSNSNFAPPKSSSVNWRTGSFHGHGHLSLRRENSSDSSKDMSIGRRRNSSSSVCSRLSIYDNVPGSILYSSTGNLADLENEDLFPELDDILYHVKGMQKIVNQWSEKFSDEGDSDSALDSISPCPSSPKQILLDVDNDRTIPSDLDSTGNSLNETEEAVGIPERRDSGVGASLTRSNRQRMRWHSFQSSHRPSLSSVALQIDCQSVAQMNLLQKYSLLKLTALLEKYTPSNKHGFSWAVPKFMKRIKVPDYKDRNVFGVPLIVNVQRTGQPLPQNIQQAMRYLRNNCLDQVGLFRKSGVKSRIQALRQMNENAIGKVNYEGQSAYDVADMLKQYFRNLSEPLMTNKLSETFLQIYQYVPKDQRLQAIKAAIMLLPDENREVLQILLYFLSDVTAAVKENQMTPTNLAVCLAPSLFHLNTLKRENSSPRVMQRKQSLGKPDQKDLNENLAATQGLGHMIAECKKLFQIPEEMSRCRNSYTEQDLRPLSFEDLGQTNNSEFAGYHSYIQDCMDDFFKEIKDKFKGWVSCPTPEPAELAYKKVCDGPPLRLWKSVVEIPATPEEVLNRIVKEQHLWDEDLLDAKVIETLDSQTDVYQFVQNNMAPHPARDCVILRTWRTNLSKGACALLSFSVEHDRAPVLGIRVNVLLSRYLIEPCGIGKSKLTYMCRIDLRGHKPDWYTKAFGHLCAAEVVRIRDSFLNQNLEAKEATSR